MLPAPWREYAEEGYKPNPGDLLGAARRRSGEHPTHARN